MQWTQAEIDQRIFDLYDEYCHGDIDRRAFLQRATAVTVGGVAMAQASLPRYARAQTISFTDPRIKARYVKLAATGFCWGGGTTNYLAVALGGDLKAGPRRSRAPRRSAGVAARSQRRRERTDVGS